LRRIREPAHAPPTGVAITRSIGPNTSGRVHRLASPVAVVALPIAAMAVAGRRQFAGRRSPVAGRRSPVAEVHQFAKAATRSVISAGPTRQQPPINEAPAAVQARTSAAEKVGVPDQLLVAAFQVSPLFG